MNFSVIIIPMNIWQKLKKNKKVFSTLAPMADVTDIAFRQIIAKYSKHGKKGGGPDVFWTEFVSADGLSSIKGRQKLLPILKFSKKEKPIIAQIFGSKPENIKIACEIISKLGFDGIDINMGCPDRAVIKQGAGSALIKNPALAREIVQAAKAGAPKLPISVKTRIGFNTIEYKTWLKELLKEDFSALTIHLRTKKEMSKVNAHHELAKDIAKTVRKYNKKIVLIVNGDIKGLKEGEILSKKSGFDGYMIGRGIFGNPWMFSARGEPVTDGDNSLVGIKEKLNVMIEHAKLFEKTLLESKRFDVMKKHFKAYANGFDSAKDLRIKLMQTKNSREAEKTVRDFMIK